MKKLILIFLISLSCEAIAGEDYFLIGDKRTTSLWSCKQAIEKAVDETTQEACNRGHKECVLFCSSYATVESACKDACFSGKAECDDIQFKNIKLSDYLDY